MSELLAQGRSLRNRELVRSLSLESLEGKSSFSGEGPGRNWILKSSGFRLSSGLCTLIDVFLLFILPRLLHTSVYKAAAYWLL